MNPKIHKRFHPGDMIGVDRETKPIGVVLIQDHPETEVYKPPARIIGRLIGDQTGLVLECHPTSFTVKIISSEGIVGWVRNHDLVKI